MTEEYHRSMVFSIHRFIMRLRLMKQEMYYGVIYYSYEELKAAIERYIKYYNEQRIKEKLGWKSPVQYRIFRQTA